MNAYLSEVTLMAILAFARVGGCFLVLPGLSGSRVPVQVRLFMVVGITVAMLGSIWTLLGQFNLQNPFIFARLLFVETVVGLFIGLSARFFLLALGFMATVVGTVIGFGNLFGPGFEETEPQAALGTLLSMSALLLLFIFDFHHAVIRSLIGSYSVVPVGLNLQTELLLMNLTQTLQESFILVLRLGSPFIAYSLVMNLMIGVLNKLTPQVPIYFISLPFLILGGLILMYFAIPTFLTLFVEGFFELRVLK